MYYPSDALHETWDSVYALSLKLADQIAGDCVKQSIQFDALVVVPRGSYYPVNIIAREFGFESTQLIHACISSYSKPGAQKAKFELGQMPTTEEVKDKDLLIIEEVCETGQTLRFLVDHLIQIGAKSVRVGTLHYKPSRSQTGYVPDWYATKTDRWIVYPWEEREEQGLNSPVRRR